MASGRAKGEVGPPIAPHETRPTGSAARFNAQTKIGKLLNPLPAAKKEAMRRAVAQLFKQGLSEADIIKMVEEAVASSK